MSDTVKIIRTDYPVLSALLTEQKQRAKRYNIPFNIDVRLESDMKITPVDLCIILGNLFDNALNVCCELPQEAENGLIYLSRNAAAQLLFSLKIHTMPMRCLNTVPASIDWDKIIFGKQLASMADNLILQIKTEFIVPQL